MLGSQSKILSKKTRGPSNIKQNELQKKIREERKKWIPSRGNSKSYHQ